MEILLAMLLAVIVAGCAARELTPAQQVSAKHAVVAYVLGVEKTIREIDDGTTSADVIARAALMQNASLRRQAAKALIADTRMSRLAEMEYLASLPNRRISTERR